MNKNVEVNRKKWNELVDLHVGSKFYDVPGFIAGGASINSVELDFLGVLTGKKVLHLQCHFGLSTIDIVRNGAEEAVGVDFATGDVFRKE